MLFSLKLNSEQNQLLDLNVHFFDCTNEKKPSLLFPSCSIAQGFKDCWETKLIYARLAFKCTLIETCIVNVHCLKTKFTSIWNKLEAINNLCQEVDFKYSFILTFSHYKETAFICSAFPIIRRNSLYQRTKIQQAFSTIYFPNS